MKTTVLTAMSILAATILFSGCNNTSPEPKITTTYHFDGLKKEIKNKQIENIKMVDGVLTGNINGISYIPEYKINYDHIKKEKCEWKLNPVINTMLTECTPYYIDVERTNEGHIYTNKFKKVKEGLVFDYLTATYTLNYKDKKITKKEVFQTDGQGEINLDFKPLLFKDKKELESVNIIVTADADKSTRFVIDITKKELVILKAKYQTTKH